MKKLESAWTSAGATFGAAGDALDAVEELEGVEGCSSGIVGAAEADPDAGAACDAAGTGGNGADVREVVGACSLQAAIKVTSARDSEAAWRTETVYPSACAIPMSIPSGPRM
jgi:hypothetical protein